ncbi:Exosome complex component RRP4 [Gracilariopsis chorda]|uniref:Exosome complex component RRP4 n=1 Tax=Gracilariopsis chorda TaxID=448386 RepID=A0A2V3ITR4_9FLOR|nr:Exosome complex component RRP4 [Gracilariopsis chorda]|eukprot:PXF45489.1 Exosome complex component RRP4 [Gracilariopsis chorda]
MEAHKHSSASFTILRPKRLSDNAEPVSRLSHVPITSPGSVIPTEDHSVRARGTLLSCGESGNVLTATRAGVISRVNKLVMVMPLRSRYIPETGDVVVGRVVEIANKRYKMDVNATKHAFLLLTAINLPGGVHRRRNQEDELNMRQYFKEGDLVSAEVQERRKDGSVALHTRSLRYGKLSAGQLVTVQSELVKRAKKHFHELPCGVHTILGNNGFIFLSQTRKGAISLEMRRRIARVANSILALDSEFIAIGPDTIMDVYQTSLANGVEVKDMCTPDVVKSICVGARSMREAA